MKFQVVTPGADSPIPESRVELAGITFPGQVIGTVDSITIYETLRGLQWTLLRRTESCGWVWKEAEWLKMYGSTEYSREHKERIC